MDGEPVSTGEFIVDDNGRLWPATFLVDRMYAESADAFVLTIEPAVDTDPGPSATHFLAGAVESDMAELSIDHMAALGTDFSSAAGEYILETPSTGSVMNDYDQGIWFLDPSAGPGPSLTLPMLPDGWMYEGWVVGDSGPMSTGRFIDTAMEDSDGAGPYAGHDPAPPFPGQDYITPPTDLTDGYAAVISIEPEPDDSPAPFALKPLMDPMIEDVGAGTLQGMLNRSAWLPEGSAVIGTLPMSYKGMELLLDDTQLETGDPFYLHYYLHNPDSAAYDADAWVLLDVFGDIWFYPSWTSMNDGVDYEANITVDPFSSFHEIILYMHWPSGLGAASGLKFYGAAFEAGSFDLIGDFQSIDWGYM